MLTITPRENQVYSKETSFIRWSIALLLLCLQCNLVRAQDAAATQSNQASSNEAAILTIKKIQQDYLEHLKKRDRIRDEYKKLEETLKQTDNDLQRINNDSLRNQLLALQSSFQSQQFSQALSEVTSQQNNPQRPRSTMTSRAQREIERMQSRLITGKVNSNLNTAIKQEELRQLDAASQLIVKRRMECIQTGLNLQNEWVTWQQEWQSFFELYWPYSDPERKLNRSEIEARLKALQESSPEDYPAMIISAMLSQRLGLHKESLSLVDQALVAGTTLDSTALYVRCLILYSMKKDNEAKATFQNANKIDAKSPHNLWVRAMIACSRQQWNSAETELKPLLNSKAFELEARRQLALIHSLRATKPNKESAKGVKEASTALDLEPKPDWFAHFVYSAALYSNGDIQESIEQIDKAQAKAKEDEASTCKTLRKAIEDQSPYKWNFDLGSLAP